MIISLDREMISIVRVSLQVSGVAIIFATLAALPFSFYLATRNFTGKKALITLLNTLMALPTVVIGLMVYSMLSRRGPLGTLGLLYTPWAMVIGQFILAFPIVSSLTLAAIQTINKDVQKTALTLGANNLQVALAIFSEGRLAILAAGIAGFSRIFAEVGVSMMLGGNIRNYTRNITTAIALETGKGEFGLSIALGIILLSIAFLINLGIQYLRLEK